MNVFIALKELIFLFLLKKCYSLVSAHVNHVGICVLCISLMVVDQIYDFLFHIILYFQYIHDSFHRFLHKASLSNVT